MIGWDSFIIINNHYTVGTGIVVYLLGVYIIVGISRWLSGKKKSPANAGDTGEMGSIPGSERFPGGGNGNPLQYSCQE